MSVILVMSRGNHLMDVQMLMSVLIHPGTGMLDTTVDHMHPVSTLLAGQLIISTTALATQDTLTGDHTQVNFKRTILMYKIIFRMQRNNSML